MNHSIFHLLFDICHLSLLRGLFNYPRVLTWIGLRATIGPAGALDQCTAHDFAQGMPQSLVILGHFLVESTLLRFQPLFALLRLLDLALQLGQLRLLRFEPELKHFDLQTSHFRRQTPHQGGEVRGLPGSIIRSSWRSSWRGSWPRSL